MPDEEMGLYLDNTNYLVTFIFEGVVLLIVALVGLVGNLASFITIFSQKVQKTFHSLLFLLSIFDMVRGAFSIKLDKNWIEIQFPSGNRKLFFSADLSGLCNNSLCTPQSQ